MTHKISSSTYMKNTFQKMNRIVFDVSRKLGKEIELEIIGEETEVDKKIIENRLPEGEKAGGAAITKEEFNKMGYNSRVALRKENPEQYDQLMKG